MNFSKSLFSFCSQIASGLRHCHQHLIVHGDVKPANVIVSPLGICKLGDFGHSIDLGKLDTDTPTHPLVDIVGTAAYAAPEVLRGSCPTPSSDMYSFGILLWQVETREIPFSGEHPHVIIYKASFGFMRIHTRSVTRFLTRNCCDKNLSHKYCELCLRLLDRRWYKRLD